MSLSAIKSEMFDKAKRTELCKDLQEAMLAATEEELIGRITGCVIYGYQAGIVTDALLETEFTESLLNSRGIYTTGSFTLTDPDEIFVLKDAVVNISLTGNGKSTINLLGNSICSIVSDDSSFSDIQVYDDAVLTLQVNDAAVAIVHLNQKGNASISQNNDSTLHVFPRGFANVDLISNNNSYTLARVQQWAKLTYTLNDSASIKASRNDAAVIIDTSAP